MVHPCHCLITAPLKSYLQLLSVWTVQMLPCQWKRGCKAACSAIRLSMGNCPSSHQKNIVDMCVLHQWHVQPNASLFTFEYGHISHSTAEFNLLEHLSWNWPGLYSRKVEDIFEGIGHVLFTSQDIF